MGALIAKLLSFFGFRTRAIAETSEPPDNAEYDSPQDGENFPTMPTIPDGCRKANIEDKIRHLAEQLPSNYTSQNTDENPSNRGSKSSLKNQGRGSRQSLKSLSSNANVDHPSAADLTVRKKGSISPQGGLIIKKIQWFGPAQAVFVSGSWVHWSEKVELSKNPNSNTVWEAEVEFPADAGADVELKFIVDEEWKTSPEMPTRVNDQGTLNNIVILNDTEI